MDINQKLLQRKLAKKKQRLNKILKIKKKFKNYQKYQEHEINDKLMNDPLAQKKLEFYDKVFHAKDGLDEFAEDRNDEVQRRKQQKWLEKQQQKQQYPIDYERNNQRQPSIEKQNQLIAKEDNGKSNRQKKLEKNLVKRIFKEKTKKGQPVMKNIIDYVVHKLENEKKTKQ